MKAIESVIKNKFKALQAKDPMMKVTDEKGVCVIQSSYPTDMFNQAFCSETYNPDEIKQAIKSLRKNKLPFCWWAGFEGDPFWLYEALTQEGLSVSEAETLMEVNFHEVLWPKPLPDLEVRPVQNKKDLTDFLSVMASIMPEEEMEAIRAFYERVYPLPDTFELWIGTYQDKPVATSSTYTEEGITAIFDVITHPDFRGKGFGKAMTAASMRPHRGKFILTATNDAKYLYEKLGFKSLKQMSVYQPTSP